MQVRLEIADTDTNAQLLQDEEINQAVSVERNMWGAAARCCEIISRQMLRKADVQIGSRGVRLTYTTAAQQYLEMAQKLRAKAIGTAAPWAGGISTSDRETLEADTSRVQPIFTKKAGTNPWVGQETLDATDDGQAGAT